MKNMGLDDWAVVGPGVGDRASARRVAVHAGDLLGCQRVAATLDEAVADCAWVVGTASRRVRGRRALSPGQVAAGVLGRYPGKTAIVFGEESSGLTRAEVLRCHDLSTIPAAPDQPSLNLAQAVLVYAWEARGAALALADASSSPPGAGAVAATDGELAALEEGLRSSLRASGFLRGPERHAVRDLAGVLRRARLTRREARLWAAALRTLERAGDGPVRLARRDGG
jgi:tRNA/rRNA methyltransferase